MLREFLRRAGFVVGRRHVRTLMLRMRMQAIFRKPNTSRKNQAHRVYPYLLRDLQITAPTADIRYIRMAKGCKHLTVVLDWYSRKVLAWRFSISMDVDFCVSARRTHIDAAGPRCHRSAGVTAEAAASDAAAALVFCCSSGLEGEPEHLSGKHTDHVH